MIVPKIFFSKGKFYFLFALDTWREKEKSQLIEIGKIVNINKHMSVMEQSP